MDAIVDGHGKTTREINREIKAAMAEEAEAQREEEAARAQRQAEAQAEQAATESKA